MLPTDGCPSLTESQSNLFITGQQRDRDVFLCRGGAC